MIYSYINFKKKISKPYKKYWFNGKWYRTQISHVDTSTDRTEWCLLQLFWCYLLWCYLLCSYLLWCYLWQDNCVSNVVLLV